VSGGATHLRPAIGMADEVNGSAPLRDDLAQPADLVGQRHEQIGAPDQIGRDDLIPAIERGGQPRPLPARAERTMQGQNPALRTG